MTAIQWQVRSGAYYDSVVLMHLQRGLLGLEDILDSGVVMATPANRDLLAANGLLPDGVDAGTDDMLVVVKGDSPDAASRAIAQVDELLSQRRTPATSDTFRPRSLGAAVKQLPDSNWVLISTPGRYAAAVAREALDLERHVFLYSDNVPLEDEISLKRRAAARGLLVMGPDCGTAIINGIGLGFANHVRAGPVGVIGASGTGLQTVTSRVHALGSGISQAIGTGSRDLSADVGAVTTLQALDLLARDSTTKVIVLISKPPAPEVAVRVLSAAERAGKPVIVDFIGYPAPASTIGSLHFALNLEHAAEIAVQPSDSAAATAPNGASPSTGYLRGLFSGGTLAYETMLSLQSTVTPLYSNVPIRPGQALADPLKSQGHTILDLGDEFFMVGRLHPMIDNDLRLRRLRQEAADPDVGLILLDVVLGEGAHPDPAAELGPAIEELRRERSDVEVAAVVIGTDEDPQDIESQVERLRAAGAVVFLRLGEGIEYVRSRLGTSPSSPERGVDLERFTRPLAAVNIGLEAFYESLLSQGAQAVQVEWRPPAGGDERLASILSRMKK